VHLLQEPGTAGVLLPHLDPQSTLSRRGALSRRVRFPRIQKKKKELNISWKRKKIRKQTVIFTPSIQASTVITSATEVLYQASDSESIVWPQGHIQT